jgi:hypothetical protein
MASIFLSGEHWIRPVAAALLIYYFFFLVNLFRKRFTRENWWTVVFLKSITTPLYIGSFITIVMFFIGSYVPPEDLLQAYIVAAIGAGVSLIGMFKQRNESSPSKN